MRTTPLPRSLRFTASAALVGLVLLPLIARPARGAEIDLGQLSAAVRARMQAFVDQGEIAGAVAVIGRSDGVLSHEAVGHQFLETRTPMAKDALFRIASMTKPVTAIGIMILADEGKLSVEDPVEKHLPEFRGQMLIAERNAEAMTLKKPPRPITLRDLLTHTSGLTGRFPEGLSDLYVKRQRTLAEGVLAVSQRPLEFEPGTRWAYCNPGIDTLGRVIEVASGESYEEFLRKRVFDPLGMTDTTFYPTQAQVERVAQTYAKRDGRLVPAGASIIGSGAGARYPVPAGGLYSTGADLARLYQMMLNQGALGPARVLSPEAVTTMTKVQTGELKTGFVDGMGFGFGWGVVRKPQGVTEHLSAGSYGHGGAFGTQGWIDPKKDVFVVLLIQRTGLPNADGSAMRKELQALAAEAVKK
jgi:CubicO group peptidase (beta-lactamase class C family)